MQHPRSFIGGWAVRLVRPGMLIVALSGSAQVWGQDATRFEAEILAFERADLLQPPPLNPVVFTGSSSVRGWPDLAGTFPDHAVLNRGFGGSHMSDLLYYFDRLVAVHHPSLVVVYEGDNDLAEGKSVDEVCGDYVEFIHRVKASIPDAGVAFLAVKPSPSRAAYLEQQREVNARLVAVADEDPRIQFIDIFTPMLDAQGQPRPELFQTDMLHMNAAGYSIWESLVRPVLDDWTSGAGQVLLLDFGSAESATELGPAPNDDPIRTWNNVTTELGTASGASLAELVTAEGESTGYGLVMIERFSGANTSGTVESEMFPADATRDSLYGNTELFNGLANVFPSFKLSGLNVGLAYGFTFYASRLGVSDRRDTEYTVAGERVVTVMLNGANNVNNGVTTPALAPDPSGAIVISLAPGAGNDNANHFTYLGALRVEAGLAQRPVVFTREPADQTVTEFESVTFEATLSGSPPWHVQWLSNGIPVPEATGLRFVQSSVTSTADGARISVTASNWISTAQSREAILRVLPDTVPPELLSVESLNGNEVSCTFSEPMDPMLASDPSCYRVNSGRVTVVSAEVDAGGTVVVLTLGVAVSGQFSVTVSGVADRAGNPMISAMTLFAEVPDVESQPVLIDFGSSGSPTAHGPFPDDPDFFWNNVTASIGGSATGRLSNLVNRMGMTTEVSLAMVRRFNGANENGTMAIELFPAEATRDSLFGNTELFGGLSEVYPAFTLSGLAPGRNYSLTFYASRLGVSDNRETAYTVRGETAATVYLDPADNLAETVTVTPIRPDSLGEVAIDLAPGPNNDNANHFTYLGVLQVIPAALPRFVSPVLEQGKMRLEWRGAGYLQWAPTVWGPWTSVSPAVTSPLEEPVGVTGERYFRVNSAGD